MTQCDGGQLRSLVIEINNEKNPSTVNGRRTASYCTNTQARKAARIFAAYN